MADEQAEVGLIASLRRVAATLVALAQTRLQLVSVELEEQLEYISAVLLWSIGAMFFAALTVLLLAFTIVIVFWDEHRLLAAGGVTASFALIALFAWFGVRRLLAERPRFFAATARELARDAATLRGERP